MTGFKAVDKSTVEITLADPNADLPTILALHHFMIVADGTTDFSKGNGTGAFVLQTFEPGVRSVGHQEQELLEVRQALSEIVRVHRHQR